MRSKLFAIGAAITLSLGFAACTPGGSTNGGGTAESPKTAEKRDPATLGNVTLTMWDQEVRGGSNEAMKKLIAEWETKYPNIKIKRVSRSFDDLVKTLRLALSGADAPDIVQANNTRSQMGLFVKAKQIVPLSSYAAAYGWDKRYPAAVRATASYTQDAKKFGEGELYGLPQLGEVVGVYYSKSKLKQLGLEVPTTWADFEQALATAKAGGHTPMMFGNLEKWPAAHVLGVIQGRNVPTDQIHALGYGNEGASWKTPENKKALETMQSWVDKGYFNSGFNGLDYDPAWQGFAKGQSVFLIGGSWLGADLNTAMGDDVGFFAPPPTEAGQPAYTTGGTGLPFAITAKSEHPDAAAAFIDFISSPDAMKVLAETNNLPVTEAKDQKAPSPVNQDLFAAYDSVSSSGALLPYLDWATPTMSNTLGAALQSMTAKQATVDQTLDVLEKDYSEFVKKNG